MDRLLGRPKNGRGATPDRLLGRLILRLRPEIGKTIGERIDRASASSPPLFSPPLPTPLDVAAGLIRSVRRTVLWLRKRPPRPVTIEGIDHLRGAVETAASRGGPLLVVGIHQGGWELLPLALTQQGFSIEVPAAPQKVFRRKIDRLRKKSGADYFPPEEIFRRILRLRKEAAGGDPRRVIALLIDQPGRGNLSDRNTGTLFGEPRPWWGAPLEFAVRNGGTLLPFSVFWRCESESGNADRSESSGAGRRELIPVVRFSPPFGGSEPVRESTAWAEREIGERPDEWVWFY